MIAENFLCVPDPLLLGKLITAQSVCFVAIMPTSQTGSGELVLLPAKSDVVQGDVSGSGTLTRITDKAMWAVMTWEE